MEDDTRTGTLHTKLLYEILRQRAFTTDQTTGSGDALLQEKLDQVMAQMEVAWEFLEAALMCGDQPTMTREAIYWEPIITDLIEQAAELSIEVHGHPLIRPDAS